MTAASLYEDIVPYRAVREALGLDLNADYEDAMLRLLAGERGLARLEPPEARDELRQELRAPYPSVGIFRKFGDCEVWVSMRSAEASPPEPPRTDAAAASPRDQGGDPGAGGSAPPTGAPRHPSGGEPQRAGTGRSDETRPCRSCGGALPLGGEIRFCPHCGRELATPPCPHCDAPMQPGWRYCVRCGHGAAGA